MVLREICFLKMRKVVESDGLLPYLNEDNSSANVTVYKTPGIDLHKETHSERLSSVGNCTV